mgnify:CR=1 FL=1
MPYQLTKKLFDMLESNKKYAEILMAEVEAKLNPLRDLREKFYDENGDDGFCGHMIDTPYDDEIYKLSCERSSALALYNDSDDAIKNPESVLNDFYDGAIS